MPSERLRMIVLIAHPAKSQGLRHQLDELAGGRPMELKIVTSVEPKSKLDLFTGDVDEEIADASKEAARSAVAAERADEIEATYAEIGDADPALAIGDALATFPAERIVLVDAEDGLQKEIEERYEVPVTSLHAGDADAG